MAKRAFAVNPGPDDIAGQRAEFPGALAEDILAVNQTYGSWSGNSQGDWFIPDGLGGSDYSGGYISKANFKAFTDEWVDHDPAFFTETFGGHGTYGVILYIPLTPDEVWEQLEGLANYPLLSDDVHSQLESEGTDEAWEQGVCDDYKRLWEIALEDDETMPEGWVDLISDDAWRDHFEECRERANTYWEASGDEPAMWISVKRVFDACDESPPLPGDPPPEAPAGAAPAEPSPAGSAPRDDTRRRRHIDELRAELDRPYRRFEPNASFLASGFKDLNALTRADPYIGDVVNAKGDYYEGLYVIGVVTRNVVHQVDPHEAAALVMSPAHLMGKPPYPYDLVFWWGSQVNQETRFYHSLFIDSSRLNELPVFTIGHLGQVETFVNNTVPEGLWDDVVRGTRAVLRGSQSSEDLAAMALYLFWYAEAGDIDPPLMDFATTEEGGPMVVRLDTRASDFEFAWQEVFETHAQRSRQVEEIMGELGMGRGAHPLPPPSSSGPTLGMLAAERRRQQIEYARGELDRPFPPRFEPNPVFGERPRSPDQDVNAFLDADPYQGIFIAPKDAHGRTAPDAFFLGGALLHNALHEESPHDSAILQLTDPKRLVFWQKISSGPHVEYEYFEIPLPLPEDMTSAWTYADVRKSVDHVPSAEWNKVIRSMELGSGDAAAIYLRWWLESQSGLPDMPGVQTVYELPEATLVEAYAEVFQRYEELLGAPVVQAQRHPSPAPAEAESRWWLEGPQEREPLAHYSPEHIEALKARGLRPGYHFNARLSEGMMPEQFDPLELARGTFVEMEHTDDVDEAKAIAMDHLAEDDQYYRKLQFAGL